MVFLPLLIANFSMPDLIAESITMASVLKQALAAPAKNLVTSISFSYTSFRISYSDNYLLEALSFFNFSASLV
jgi:hypothetical protein